MKNRIFYILCILLLGASCSKDETQTVYLPAGQKTMSEVFAISDEPHIVKFVASLTGADYATVSNTADKDITISFAVDMSLVEKYNNECGTDFLPAPDNSYRIPESALIQKGRSMSDSVSISIFSKGKFESFVAYMIPIKITGVQGANANQYQQVIYLTLSGVADPENIPIYDRTNWEIVDFSTEEPGEGGGNGLAKCLIDDKPGTFWHSKWAGGTPGPPHHVTFDMGETKILHGIAIMNRDFDGDWAINGHSQPKNIKIEVSLDGTTWKENGTFSNLPIGEGQPFRKFFFSSYNQARYIKLTINESYKEIYTCFAEFGAF